MRKVLSFFTVLFVLTMAANAQDESRQRAGIHAGYGFNSFFVEGSYQYDISDKHRLEGNTGAAYFYDIHTINPTDGKIRDKWTYSLGGSFQWNGPITEGAYWYIGPAAMLYINNEVNLSVGLQMGAECRIGIPIRLGIDFRPMISLEELGGNYFDCPVFLSIRWCF